MGFKKKKSYFIGSNYDGIIRPLCIKLPQIIGYVKHFDSSKIIYFRANDNRLIKNILKYGKESDI